MLLAGVALHAERAVAQLRDPDLGRVGEAAHGRAAAFDDLPAGGEKAAVPKRRLAGGIRIVDGEIGDRARPASHR
jgi:hypothetical protein